VQGDHSWFSEGLTVYSTTVLPYRGGLVSLDQYAVEINRNAQAYYSNKARNRSQAQIEKLGMDDEEARRVPYDRGNLYYADLDAQVSAKSHGKRGLYDMLAPLFQERKNDKTFDQTAWEEALRHELGPKAVKQFHDVVIEGTATVVPASNAFGSCLERHAKVWKSADGKAIAEGYQWQAVAGATSTSKPSCSF
jgi:predicted metalloprotease with PDZ domain